MKSETKRIDSHGLARSLGWVRDLALILSLGGVALGALELGARAVKRVVVGPPTDARVEADVYAGAPWVRDLYRELAACDRVEHEAYVGWRREPFAGAYVNVGEDGRRRTWNASPALEGEGRPLTVFFMGGSTMWGTGARDEHTVPSAVSRRLAAGPGPSAVCVNQGETGFVSTQELVRLERCLQVGDVPDVVVFLDGVNDVFSAFQSREAGLPHNESFRRHEFNLLKHPLTLMTEGVRQAVAGSEIVHLLRREAPVRPLDEALAKRLSVEVARVYAANVSFARALAQAKGFHALFYLQPVVFTKPRLTEFESRDATEREYLRTFYLRCYDECRKLVLGVPGFHDLSGIFESESQPRFLDLCHLGEPGNEALADRIAPDVARCLAAKRVRLASAASGR